MDAINAHQGVDMSAVVPINAHQGVDMPTEVTLVGPINNHRGLKMPTGVPINAHQGVESRADMNGRKLKANEPPTSWEARSQEKKVQGQ